jgi:hypothetical protein
MPVDIGVDLAIETGERLLQLLVADDAPGTDHVRNDVNADLGGRSAHRDVGVMGSGGCGVKVLSPSIRARRRKILPTLPEIERRVR